MRPFSLEGKLALLLLLAVVAGAGAAVLLELAIDSDLLAFVAAVAVTVPLVLLAARLVTRPISELFRTLSGAVASFRDGDFSFSIHRSRNDELGDLVGAHNELGRVLRDERQDLFQRELLLHTVVQNTPNALLLADSRDHVVYSNVAARQLLTGGRRLEGLTLEPVLAESPAALR